ncbi:MAG: MaoC family dehydratase [Blastocatellia bacterium]|nr:MaoC family dehydratase [Blastocatellia bacterium]
MELGQLYRSERTFKQSDIDKFAEISWDDNPVHVNSEYAASTRFGKTICHGMLAYSFIYSELEKLFPEFIQKEQEVSFLAPTFPDEEMSLRVEVIEVMQDGNFVVETSFSKSDNTVACKGKSTLKRR